MNRSPWEAISAKIKTVLGPSAQVPKVASDPGASQQSLASASLEAIQKLVASVCQATADAASEVNDYQSRVQTIADELGAAGLASPATVAGVVQKLLVANAELQERLQRTERAIESHQRQLNATVRAARTDALTGLCNRRMLETRLKRALNEHAQGRPPSTLFMLDLDHFKSLNDRHGHMAGDAALRQVGQILERHAGRGQLVARYGGEEFAVLFPCPLAEAAPHAERMREAIAQTPFIYEGEPIPLTASGGLAEPVAGDSLTGWIERADKALYAAKRQGRNCTFQMVAGGTVQLFRAAVAASEARHTEEPRNKWLQAAEADLAAEAFADATFPEQIARRIAEWRRGGSTLTVVLVRVVADSQALQPVAPTPAQMRAVHGAVQRQVRAMDVLTRWHSDGLALLLPGMGAREARGLMTRWLRALPQVSAAEGGQIGPGYLRAGIAEGLEGNDARRVLERAWLAVQASLQDAAGRMFLHDGVRVRPLPTSALPATSC